nr:unnamed protein product [Callosobruchus analis]
MTARVVWLLLHMALYQFDFGESNIQPLNLLPVATRVSLDRCIIAAAKKYFARRFNTVLFSLPIAEGKKEDLAPIGMDRILLQELYKEYRWTVVMKHFGGRAQGRDIGYYPKSYLIQIRSRDEAKINIKYLSRFASWNPHAKFLVVSSKVFNEPEEVVLETFQALFAANTVSIAVMLPDPKNTTNLLVFSWRPEANRTCSPDHLEALLINTCYFGKIKKKETWFPDVLRIKRQRDYGCSVKVSYLLWPPFVIENEQKLDGIEVSLLRMIEERLDVVMEFEKTCRNLAMETDHRIFCGTYTPIWLPFDMDTRIIYVLQMFFTCFIPIPSAVLCFMFVQVAELIISHLSYLKEQIEYVFDEPNANLRVAKLRRCSMNLGAIIFLCGYMVALFCFSYAGQRLKDESVSICDVLYKLKWYRITAYEQRNVLYMTVRSQYPLILDATPLGSYGYPLFLMVSI